MTTRVTLISPAASEASEAVRFDDGRPLSTAGLRQLRAVSGALPQAAGGGARTLASPSRRCTQTAEQLGLPSVTEVRQAAGCGMGRWRGRTLEEVAAAEPESVVRWLSDPDAAPHGGETVRELCARIDAWLNGLAAEPGRVLAVVEPDVVRAAVVGALGAPAESLWRVDVEPLTATEFSGRGGRWNVRPGRRLDRS